MNSLTFGSMSIDEEPLILFLVGDVFSGVDALLAERRHVIEPEMKAEENS